MVDALVLETSGKTRAGSSPVSPTNLARWRVPHRASGWRLHLQTKSHYGSVAQMAVHVLGKDEVSGSNPLGASIIITMRCRWFYSVVE